MTFDEILPAVMAGGKARRTAKDWVLEQVRPSIPDGRPVAPLFVVAVPGEDQLLPWGRSDADLQAGDWQLA